MIGSRALLRPLVPVYAAIVSGKARLFDAGRLPTRTLEQLVISVGSVSAGGAGKTPMVLLLAEALDRRKYAVRILTRGYGRGSDAVERVDPAGDALRYGDEPVLLARRSGAPVYVGADRYRAGVMAEAEAANGLVVHLLDDGFQHRQLARDLDVVLLTRADVEDGLLPAGNLREPLSALERADVIVLREEEAAGLVGLVSGLRGKNAAMPIWKVRRTLRLTVGGGAVAPLRAMAFCGIARPEGFLGMLEADGCRPVGTVVFGDHHRYRERDMERLVEEARTAGADGFVTTEKDAVKLTGGMRRRLEEVGPLMIARLELVLLDEKAAIEQMIAMVPRMNRRKGR